MSKKSLDQSEHRRDHRPMTDRRRTMMGGDPTPAPGQEGRTMSKLEQYWKTLELSVVDAEAAAASSAPVVSIHKALSAFIGVMDNASAEDAGTVASALGDQFPTLIGLGQSARDLLARTGKVTGADRTEGDLAAKALTSAVEFNLDLPDGVTEEDITAAVARWNTTKPKGSGSGSGTRGAGSGKWTPLGFTVAVSCKACGDKVVASTGTNNMNSLRDAVRPHDRKVHADSIGTRGSALFDSLSAAIKGAMTEATDGEAGTYRVTRQN